VVGFRNLWNGRGATVRASAHMLYTDLAAAALQPVLYEQGAARDTFEGRAAMITANATLVIRRLRRIDSAHARKIAEHVNSLVLDGFDAAFRELGVGDSSIARKVRKLAELHYGLGKALMEALSVPQSDTRQTVSECVRRNGVSEPDKDSLLAAFLLHNAACFAAAADEDVLAGKLSWQLPGQD
jgi:cytochrome b pre-mRNA-processing protein 3